MSRRRAAWVLCSTTSVLLACLAVPCAAKGPRSAQDFFKRGMSRYSAKDFDGAIEDFTSVIAINSNIDNHVSRTSHRLKSDLESEKEKSSHDEILVHDKLNAVAYYNRGRARMEKGDWNEAMRDFDNAIALNPRDGWAFNNRGYVKWMAGDKDGAIRDYDRAVQLSSNDPAAHFNRGIFCLRILDVTGAIADFSHAIKLDPGMAPAFHNRANAQMLRGMLNEALGDYNRALELDSTLWVTYLNRGLTLTLQGKDDEARRDFACYLRHAGEKEQTVEKLAQHAREARLATQR